MRKTSDEDARRKQDEMAQATLRKLNRRINRPRWGEFEQYKTFLLAAREDLVGRIRGVA